MRTFAVLVSAAIATALSQPDEATLNGRVIKAHDGTPLRYVNVDVHSVTGGQSRTLSTGSDGTFIAARLPAGHYVVRVLAEGYWQRPIDRTSPIALAPGASAPIVIRMWRGGVVTGRVVDAEGTPVGDIPVQPLVSEFRGEREVLRQLPARLTDDRGVFRLFGLDPGTYYVAASPGHARDLKGAPRRERVVTYHPGATSATEAQAIIVEADREIAIGDLAIRPTATGTLEGHVFNARGLPAAGVEMLIVPAAGPLSSAMPSTTSSSDGSFSFADLPPGQYVLQNLPAAESPEFGASQVAIGPGPQAVTLHMLKPRSARARIIFEDGEPDFSPSQLQFHMAAPDRAASPVARGASARTLDNWSVDITNVWGPHYLSLRAAPRHWMLKQLLYDAGDRTLAPIDFAAASELTIVLSRRTAAVSGAVLDAGRRRVSGASVLIFPADPDKWSDTRRIRLVRTGIDGTFDADAFPGGRYLLSAAAAFDDTGDWPPRPSALEALRGGAVEVSLSEGRRENATLTVAERVR